MLWFGWFGFNSGSALAATELAALAFANTQIATAAAMFTWIVLDISFKKHASAEGATSGAVVGLVAITPCAGFVHTQSSLAIGVLCTFVVYGSIWVKAKYFTRYFPQLDDSLDVFTCHGIGAVAGALLLGFFSALSQNPEGGANGVFFGNPIQLAYQLTGVVATIVWSCVFTALILLPLKYTIGLSAVPEKTLSIGMDRLYHGSTANPEADESEETDERKTQTTGLEQIEGDVV